MPARTVRSGHSEALAEVVPEADSPLAKILILCCLKDYSKFIIQCSIFIIEKYRIMNFEYRIKTDE